MFGFVLDVLGIAAGDEVFTVGALLSLGRRTIDPGRIELWTPVVSVVLDWAWGGFGWSWTGITDN